MQSSTDNFARSRPNAGDDVVGPIASTIPLRAQLWHKQLTSEALLVLFAMLEGDSTGQTLYPSIPRIAAYSKLSERTVQKIIHGEDRKPRDPRTAPKRRRALYVGLIERRVLVQIAPANATKRRAATYRLQLEALPDCPRTERWRQKKLPFPADEIELQKWIHHNPASWSQIKHDLRMAAEARVGAQPLSPAASAALMVSVARKHGMPHRFAELCMETSRK